MCHRFGKKTDAKTGVRPETDRYGDGDVPEVDTDPYKNVEPLPESTRERRDGPGGD